MKSFTNFLKEKHLTPNELKKREEIAQSMEKKNPGMPMDKKMAIATSVAKKVTEAVAKSGGVGKDLDGLRRHPEWNVDDYEKWKNRGMSHADIKELWGQRAAAKKAARSEVHQEIKNQEKEKAIAAKTAAKAKTAKKSTK